MLVRFRVTYDSAPIRHAAVQCPYCKKWYRVKDIVCEDFRELKYDDDLTWAEFVCPLCGKKFSGRKKRLSVATNETLIEEVAYPDVYEDCFFKKETWVNEQR